jgi:hypothetical protein
MKLIWGQPSSPMKVGSQSFGQPPLHQTAAQPLSDRYLSYSSPVGTFFFLVYFFNFLCLYAFYTKPLPPVRYASHAQWLLRRSEVGTQLR